jgi:hypothetical protein
MAVIVSGEKSGLIIIKIGTKINPPPAPIKVPRVPIKKPMMISK